VFLFGSLNAVFMLTCIYIYIYIYTYFLAYIFNVTEMFVLGYIRDLNSLCKNQLWKKNSQRFYRMNFLVTLKMHIPSSLLCVSSSI
jgi:hypothetical protein